LSRTRNRAFATVAALRRGNWKDIVQTGPLAEERSNWRKILANGGTSPTVNRP